MNHNNSYSWEYFIAYMYFNTAILITITIVDTFARGKISPFLPVVPSGKNRLANYFPLIKAIYCHLS